MKFIKACLFLTMAFLSEASLLAAPRACLLNEGQSAFELDNGAHLFPDRGFTLHNCPNALKGCAFLKGTFASQPITRATVAKDGIVTVISPEQSFISQARRLKEQGFAIDTTIPPFQAWGSLGCDRASVWRKFARKGERIVFGQWGIVCDFDETGFSIVHPTQKNRELRQRLSAEFTESEVHDINVTSPDYAAYIPPSPGKRGQRVRQATHDTYNDHFQVIYDSVRKAHYAFWTQATQEPMADHHTAFRKSTDGGRNWSPLKVLAGTLSTNRALIAKAPGASWQQPMLTKRGRLYVFWSRAYDHLMGGRYSDDGGETWSEPDIVNFDPRTPREKAENKGRAEWWCNWQRPLRLGPDGHFLVGSSRGRDGLEFWEWTNIDDHPAIRDVRIKVHSSGEKALKVPNDENGRSVCEEASIVKLPDGRLFAVMRATGGAPVWSVSPDCGVSWSRPEQLRVKDGGELIGHSVSPCPVYDWKGCTAGSGMYFGLFHFAVTDHRGPLYLVAGRYDAKARQPVAFDGAKQIFEPRSHWNSFYTSYTEQDGQGTLWYPDAAKFYLLGRDITADWMGYTQSSEAKVFRFGKWTLDARSFALSYGKRRIVDALEIGYWSANYAKGLSDGRWQAEPRMDGVSFTRKAKAVTTTLDFTFKAESVKQRMTLDVHEETGPIEYGFRMRPADFSVAPNRSIVRINSQYVEVTDEPFNRNGAREFSWETPAASYIFRNDTKNMGFVFQDLRSRSSDRGVVRYIHCSKVASPCKRVFENTWSVNDAYGASTRESRGKVLSGSLRSGLLVQVPNQGFEEGRTAWSLPANATIDETVAHSGKKSLRIEIAEKPHQGNVYVTQLVPVKEGEQYKASCWVRTLGVAEAKESKIGQCGATIIVEWADKNRRWFQGGAYAHGLWGTNGWKRLSIDRVTAPPNAAYAYVYLALRAKGKAWFDDFALEKLSYAVNKKTPREGVTIRENTPFFSWASVPGWRSYKLLLSRKADFPERETLSFPVGGYLEYRLTEPIGPGTWHWKVVTKGVDDLLPGVFSVTSPVDADCLPPLVATKARRVTRSDEAFDVTIIERNEETPTVEVALGSTVVAGKLVERAANGNLTYRFAAPKGGWPGGFVEGETTARDKAGNCERKPFYFFNAPPPPNSVKVGEDGRMRQNGKTVFPFGIYQVDPDDLADVRSHGFDVVHQYEWESSQDDEHCRKYLDACWRTDGLRAFIGFDRGNGSQNGLVQGNFAHVAHRVGALADHPGLFCWYLFDEPELLDQFIAPDLLIAYADLIRALDPYHPVVMTTWNATMAEYRRSWDTHWTQAYGAPATALSILEQHRGFLKNASPITLLISCTDGRQTSLLRKGVKCDPEKFSPDRESLRAQAYLSIVRNCNGLWMWWFARHCSVYYTVAHNAKAWAGVGEIMNELKRTLPIVTADGEAKTGLHKTGKATIAWWVKKVAGKTHLIAVNTSEDKVTTTIDLPEIGKRELSFARYEVRNEAIEKK